jgi:hypothetical protein
MPVPFLTPSDRILRSIKRTLQAFDWIGAGLTTKPTIRHARRRFSQPEEYPCITIRWEQDEPRAADQDQNYISAGEALVDMRVTLEVEFDPESFDDDGLLPTDDEDETGLGFASALAFLGLRALKDPNGDLCLNWANSVSDRGRGEDPDSTPDEARFEQSIFVLYRVSTEDPSVILAQGMNA